jgi:hypothetical protein
LPFAAAVVIRLGLGNTSYDTADSLGRTMGFNDLLYAEHYRIIVGNFRPSDLFRLEHWYEWLLLAAQLVGVCLLLGRSTTTNRLTRWYFASQALLFPFGVFFAFFAPLMMYGLLMGQRSDRESFVDIPFVMVVGQGSWLLIATLIAFAMKGPGLGFRRMWLELKSTMKIGGRATARE